MRHQVDHPVQGAGSGDRRLEGEPLVHDERVAEPPLLEPRERLSAFLAVDSHEAAERGDRIGHVVGARELVPALAPGAG